MEGDLSQNLRDQITLKLSRSIGERSAEKEVEKREFLEACFEALMASTDGEWMDSGAAFTVPPSGEDIPYGSSINLIPFPPTDGRHDLVLTMTRSAQDQTVGGAVAVGAIRKNGGWQIEGAKYSGNQIGPDQLLLGLGMAVTAKINASSQEHQ